MSEKEPRPIWRKKRYMIPASAAAFLFGVGLAGNAMDLETEEAPVSASETTEAPAPTPEAPEPSEERTEAPEATPEPEEPAYEIVDVPDEKVAAILAGTEDGLTLEATGRDAAILTEAYGDPLVIIAAEFAAEDLSTEVGVWASSDLEAYEGFTWSVDGTAQNFTVWPNGTATFQPDITMPEARAVTEALE